MNLCTYTDYANNEIALDFSNKRMVGSLPETVQIFQLLGYAETLLSCMLRASIVGPRLSVTRMHAAYGGN